MISAGMWPSTTHRRRPTVHRAMAANGVGADGTHVVAAGLLVWLICDMIAMVNTATGVASMTTAWTPPFCPHLCRCSNLMSGLTATPLPTTDCSNHGFTETPANVSSETESLLLNNNRIRVETMHSLDRLCNLTQLSLADNHIYTLEEWTVTSLTLQYLVIDRNQLDYLGNRTFRGFPSLRYLSVVHNKIEVMHKEAFRGLINLKTLVISGNRIFSVDADWFYDLSSSLNVLDLRENNIHVIRDGDFRFLSKLKILQISANQLHHIYDNAFQGMTSLQQISLQANHLKTVPLTALQKLIRLSTLNLSNNHISHLDSYTFRYMNITILRLNNLDNLELVDRYAFSDLPQLKRLELYNNRRLQYVDRAAFIELPRLQALLLHNNNVSVLEEGVVRALPALSLLSLHHNPIVCDCVINWIARYMAAGTGNITWEAADAVVCAAPPDLKGKRVAQLGASARPGQETCRPRVLPLPPADYNTVLGDSVRMDCRAVGVPIPQTNWLLPTHLSGEVISGVEVVRPGVERAAAGGHITVTKTGTLSISYIQGIDRGVYTCLASNPGGRDQRTSRISVRNLRANVIIIGVTSRSVTVTWKSTRYVHDYQILYKMSNTNHTYRIITIKPYMRTYTASNLLPDTHYEFCLAVKHESQSVRINCTVVITHDKHFTELGLFNLRNYIIGGALGVLVGLLVLICIVTYFLKRYNKRRRQQEELYSDNLSQLFLASIDSMSDTTPITYENRAVSDMFDDDDIEEIRSTASMASTSTSIH